MNNLLSYYGLVDARITASEKDLPVICKHKNLIYKLLDSLTPQDLYYFLQDAAKCHSPTVWRLAATFFVTKQMRTPKIISHHDGKNQAYSLQDTDT